MISIDKLVEIVKMYSEEDSYDRKQYFVSMKNILSILSRLVVFTEDANVIVFLEILSRFSQKEDSFIVRDIKKILQIISTRFNGNIANACQNIIFSEFDAQYHLASYFDDVSFEIYEELTSRGEDINKIVIMTTDQFRLIYKVKLLINEGKSKDMITSILKIHPYRVKLAMEASYNFTNMELIRYIKTLGQIDINTKMGVSPNNYGFDLFLLNL